MIKNLGWILVCLLVLPIVVGLGSFAHEAEAAAGINNQIPFTGTLNNSSGTALSGTYDMVFRIYDSLSGGSTLWTGTHTAGNSNVVSVSGGVFQVLLGSGSGNALDLDFNDDTYYLGITIESDSEMSPRTRLGASGYSFNSDTVDGLHAGDLIQASTTGRIEAASAASLFTLIQNGVGNIVDFYDGGSLVFSVNDTGLTTASNLNVTGSLYDSATSTGSLGMVLQSTGTSTIWVATSTLGLGGGGATTLTGLTDTTISSPANGQLLSYNGSAWVNTATSTLNIEVADLSGTADDLSEGSTNLFFTDNRFDTRLSATTTLPNLTALANLASIGTITSGVWNGSVVDISSYTNLGVSALGIGISGDNIVLTSGYNVPLTASTSNWNIFFDTPSNRIAAGNALSWSGNTLNVGSITTTEITDGTITESDLNLNAPTNGYVLQASSTSAGAFVWVATSTLGLGGGGASTFLALTDTPSSFTSGSLLFTSGSAVTENNANLFWDNASNRLGIGTTTPSQELTVQGNGLFYSSSTNYLRTYDTTNISTDGTISPIITSVNSVGLVNLQTKSYTTAPSDDDFTGFLNVLDIDMQVADSEFITGIENRVNYSGTTESSSWARAQINSVYVNGGGRVTESTGLGSSISVENQSTSTYNWGVSTDVTLFGTSSADQAVGLISGVYPTTGSTINTEALAGWFLVNSSGAGSYIDAAYGVRLDVRAYSSSVIDDGYALYIEDVIATNEYSIYQAGTDDTNYFAGLVGVGTTTPSARLTVYNTGSGDSFRIDDQAGDTTPFVIDTTGQVGIGTSSPASKLDVWGDFRVGTSSTPTLFTEVSTGRVGIGNNNPSYALDITGSISATGNFRTSQFIDNDNSSYYVNPSSGSASAILNGSVRIGTTTASNAHLSIQTTGTTDILNLFETGGTEVVTVLESGNVGIGTTSPSRLLTVDGDAYIGGALYDNSNSVGTNGMLLQTTGSGFNWVATSTLGLGGGSGATTFLALTDTPSSFTSGSLLFTSGSAVTEDNASLFFDDATNRLGIGTTNPTSTFEIVGTAGSGIFTVSSSSGSTILTVTSNDDFIIGSYQKDDTGTGNEDNRLFFDVAKGAFRAGSASASQWNAGNVGTSSIALGAGAIASGERDIAIGSFVTANSVNTIGALAFGYDVVGTGDRSIAFGVGNQSGGANPTVSGGDSVGFFLGDNSDSDISGARSFGIFMNQTSVDIAVDDTFAIMGGTVGIGTTSPTAQLSTTGSVRFSTFGAGSVTTDASGNIIVSSDERLKDILGFYEAGLDEVLQIEPIEFNWLEETGFDTENTYTGFSAQNVQLVLPEAVGEDSKGFLTLSDRPILAAAINAIQEIWQVVSGNKDKIESLEARISALEGVSDTPTNTEVSTDNSYSNSSDSSSEDNPEPADALATTTIATEPSSTTTTTEVVNNDEIPLEDISLPVTPESETNESTSDEAEQSEVIVDAPAEPPPIEIEPETTPNANIE